MPRKRGPYVLRLDVRLTLDELQMEQLLAAIHAVAEAYTREGVR